MDLKFEERLFPGGDDRKPDDHEDEKEHVFPIKRVAGEMLVHGEQKSVARMDDVKDKGGEPDDCDPGKKRPQAAGNQKKIPGTRI